MLHVYHVIHRVTIWANFGVWVYISKRPTTIPRLSAAIPNREILLPLAQTLEISRN